MKIIDQNYFEGHLKLQNNLKNEYVVLKIINDKPVYSITPTLHYIEPGKELIVNFKRFEKLSINEIKNINDILIVVATHTKNKVEDANDAKIYIKKEDLFSPEYQLYTYTINLDNGHNPNLYMKEEKEREIILKHYNNQLNMNNISNKKEVREVEMEQQIKNFIEKCDNKGEIFFFYKKIKFIYII